MFEQKMPRRTVLKSAVSGLAVIPVLGFATRAQAADVDVNDPQAKGLGYIADATKIDAKAFPTYKPEQKCSNCSQYKGAATDASAPCTIFAGKTVPAGGWCKVWSKKPA